MGIGPVYAKLGIDAGHSDMPGHLLTASVLRAPAALLISKVMLPETEKSETAGAATAAVPRTTTNSIDALCRGASDGRVGRQSPPQRRFQPPQSAVGEPSTHPRSGRL